MHSSVKTLISPTSCETLVYVCMNLTLVNSSSEVGFLWTSWGKTGIVSALRPIHKVHGQMRIRTYVHHRYMESCMLEYDLLPTCSISYASLQKNEEKIPSTELGVCFDDSEVRLLWLLRAPMFADSEVSQTVCYSLQIFRLSFKHQYLVHELQMIKHEAGDLYHVNKRKI